MDSSELLKKVRKIEIKSRMLSNHIFAGEYHSAFKGKGMTFSEVRGYQYGDPIKDIDWHVTARFNQPYIKVFEEERELTVMLLIDVSGSEDFGTRAKQKKDLIAEIAAVLSFSAIENNDKIGVIFVSDKVESFIPPQKFLTNAIKKRSAAFIISDFMSPDFSESLKIAASKHDIAALKVYDPFEESLPNVGLAYFRDMESGEMRWIDTASASTRNEYGKWWKEKNEAADLILTKAKVDKAVIRTDGDYVKPLIALFKNR